MAIYTAPIPRGHTSTDYDEATARDYDTPRWWDGMGLFFVIILAVIVTALCSL